MAPQARNYCFTWNNYGADEAATSLLHETLNDGGLVRYAVVGKEVGSEGTPHLQGYVSFKTKQSLVALKKRLPVCIHWEVAKGNEKQNTDYCTKDGDFETYGKAAAPGKRSDLESAISAIKDGQSMSLIAENHSSTFVKFGRGLRDLALHLSKKYNHPSVRGIWIYGAPGTGKSHEAREAFPEPFLKAQSKWWDGYTGQRHVLLDDLDSNCLGHFLKIWADKYSCTGETKGGTIYLQHKVFVVTSNYHPREIFKDDPMMADAILRRFLCKEKIDRETSLNLQVLMEDPKPEDSTSFVYSQWSRGFNPGP